MTDAYLQHEIEHLKSENALLRKIQRLEGENNQLIYDIEQLRSLMSCTTERRDGKWSYLAMLSENWEKAKKIIFHRSTADGEKGIPA